MNQLQSNEKGIVINDSTVPKNTYQLIKCIDRIVLQNGSFTIDLFSGQTELDGVLSNSIDEIYNFCQANFFKIGGGDGTGVTWDDTSMMPVGGKIPVFSPQGLLSTGTPQFPENAVPLSYLDVRLSEHTGWAIYNDSAHTSSSPLVSSLGVRTKITNNASVVINDQLPVGVSSFWDSSANKITPDGSGDSYIINIRFVAVSTSNQGLADIEIDIGGNQTVVSGSTISMRKGTGAAQRINLNFDVYTGDTFLENGGEIYITSIDGDTSIHDVRLKITRVHKAV